MSQPIDPHVQIILIDDDPHLRQALYQTLDLAGLKVLPLAQATGLGERIGRDWPGVVVSDIRMPGMDGLELLAQLHAHGHQIARGGCGAAQRCPRHGDPGRRHPHRAGAS